MKKRICLLCICFCISLCACHRTVSENESISWETDQNISDGGTTFLECYTDFSDKQNAKRVALIYVDEDSVPELLILKNGEYSLYSFDGSQIKPIAMPDTEIKANAFGAKHDFEQSIYQTFYWFEYVPYKGLIRVHSGDDRERNDYYLKYTDGSLITELKTKSIDDTWHTYYSEKEIENEEFLNRLSDLGYDKLVPCGYLYENVTTAYENIGAVSDSRKMLEDFVSGKTDALDYVTEIHDIPEEGFVMRSYNDFYTDVIEEDSPGGSAEYIDFDNDGEDELMIRSYTGLCVFFDVIGDTVYKVLETEGSTTDVVSVAVIEGQKVIARTDVLHSGRKSYRIMKYDSCCCLVDWFRLYTSYEGTSYTEQDRFEYRNRNISMEEFDKILNSIHQL